MAFCHTGFAQNQPVSDEAAVKVDAPTRAVIKAALKYLAGQQHLDGSWSLREGTGGYPVAMTGYTLLAFMAAGNLPTEGEYAKNVSLGTQFLLDSIQPDGLFRNGGGGQYMYNHGIATVALAELYGESHSPAMRNKLQEAVDVILKAQNPAGGWRYTPQPRDADISVTVLQAVALRAAQGAGLAVPRDAIDKAIQYVDSCYHPDAGAFSYQPGPKQQPGFARTAAAIYSLQVLGKYDDPRVKTGSAYLFAHLKDRGYWSYGNYYAAPAQYMVGGETWRTWYAQLSKIILDSVKRDGDPEHWQPTLDGGRLGPIFITAVYVHILAMPYHFLPLYQR